MKKKKASNRFKTKSVFFHTIKLWSCFPQAMWMQKFLHRCKNGIKPLKRNLCLAGRPLSCRWPSQTFGHFLHSFLAPTLAAAGGIPAPG